MIEFERPNMPLDKERTLDYEVSENERLNSYLEYVAMMADIELPTDEEAEDMDYE